MKRENRIIMVNITEEAEFDFYDITKSNTAFPLREIQDELKEYLTTLEESERLDQKRYIRVKYNFEELNCMMMFYLYKAEKFGIMQVWNLVGISFDYDWSEELEDEGIIRNWLKSKIAELPDDLDWVEEYNIWLEKEKKRSED